MTVLKISSITDIDTEKLESLLKDVISNRYKELLIKNNLQINECSKVIEDNCYHYVVILNPEFDSATKTEDDMYITEVTNLLLMTLRNNFETTETSLFTEQ